MLSLDVIELEQIWAQTCPARILSFTAHGIPLQNQDIGRATMKIIYYQNEKRGKIVAKVREASKMSDEYYTKARDCKPDFPPVRMSMHICTTPTSA